MSAGKRPVISKVLTRSRRLVCEFRTSTCRASQRHLNRQIVHVHLSTIALLNTTILPLEVDTKRTCPQLLCRCQIPRRARRVNAEVRVRRLAAGPRRAVAAHEAAATVEALRARDPARRQRPGRVCVDRRQVRAPRERVEQVRERGRVESAEVDRRECAGAERTEASIYSPLTKMV